MDGAKRILVFSMAGGTGRSYHADLSCANTARRVHYLLEPGWRSDQAIQRLGRTHRTHQASAPRFRPIATDVKGERRFISTIARRLDSLGAITRGQRDSQTAMCAEDASLFRARDNLESLHATTALRQLYIALWRGHVEGWPVDRFETATGLSLTWQGEIREDLPPMPKFLNRLLALPIDEQNGLFGELETRIDANIDQAVEAGTFERGVETIRAESLTVVSRETVHVHGEPGPWPRRGRVSPANAGAATELVEILRRDPLDPTTAEDALALRDRLTEAGKASRLMRNRRSGRIALAHDAPARMLEDGAIDPRVRMVRPSSRETMSHYAADASSWRDVDEAQWRALWDAEVAGLPAHTESRMRLVTGLLLPLWDRLPPENMRVRRLTTDDGHALIGRTVTAEQAIAFRAACGLEGGPEMAPAEMHDAILVRGESFPLANGWRIAHRAIAFADRIEVEGPADTDLPALKRLGCVVEIVSWKVRVFVPGADVLERLIERYPLAPPAGTA